MADAFPHSGHVEALLLFFVTFFFFFNLIWMKTMDLMATIIVSATNMAGNAHILQTLYLHYDSDS